MTKKIKAIPDLTLPERVRFSRKVGAADASGCWNWKGKIGAGGYGVTFVGGLELRPHRVAWRLWRGEDPGESHVLHRCDNPACVNPAHLFLGTNDENIRDKVAKGRQTFGERNPGAKLTRAQAIELRRRAASGERTQDLAREFGVHPATARRIRAGDLWRDGATRQLQAS